MQSYHISVELSSFQLFTPDNFDSKPIECNLAAIIVIYCYLLLLIFSGYFFSLIDSFVRLF